MNCDVSEQQTEPQDKKRCKHNRNEGDEDITCCKLFFFCFGMKGTEKMGAIEEIGLHNTELESK